MQVRKDASLNQFNGEGTSGGGSERCSGSGRDRACWLNGQKGEQEIPDNCQVTALAIRQSAIHCMRQQRSSRFGRELMITLLDPCGSPKYRRPVGKGPHKSEGNKKRWRNGLRSYQHETIKLCLWVNLPMANKKTKDDAQVQPPNDE